MSNVLALHDSHVLSLAGALTIGANLALGAAVDLGTFDNTVRAFLAAGTEVDAGDTVEVLADSNLRVVSLAAAVAASTQTGTGISGSFSELDFFQDVQAFIGNGATVTAIGDVEVTATDELSLVAVSGTGAGSKKNSFGLALTDNDITRTVKAYIDNEAQVTALGLRPGGECPGRCQCER